MGNISKIDYKSNLTGYLPMNLDLDKHLKEHPPAGVDGFDRDSLVYILSLITRIPARAERQESEYVSLKAEYLRNRVHNFRQYVDYCLNTGILETDGYYLPGKKSKGYKFSDQFLTRVQGEPIVKYSLVRAENKELEQKNRETETKYSYLTDHFNNDLKFDYQGARDLLINTTSTAQQYNFSLVHLDELKAQEYRYSVDGTARRFHSNLTNLKSDFRQFLSYGNDTLVSVDISNSQPFFSLCLLDKVFYKNDGAASNFTLNFFNSSKYFIPLPIPIIPLMMEAVDIEIYRELVLSGKIYEFLGREIYDEHGIIYQDRRELKAEFFHAFYSPNQTIGNPDAHLRRLFKNRFPSVYEFFSILKRKDHRVLPILLQRIESYLVLEVICPQIAHLRPHLPIYTIHDSIITTQGNEGFIAAIMTERIKNITGHKPNLKIEQWKKI